MINLKKLMREFEVGGIEVGGANTNSIIWGVDGTTEIQEQAEVAAVIDAHNPAWDVTVKADKDEIAADGVEQVMLSVQTEHTGDIVIAVYDYATDERIGSLVVPSDGKKAVTISVSGKYYYQADESVLESTGVNKYRSAGQTIVEAI